MPLIGKKEFQSLGIPEGVLPNTDVFYLAPTNEVFIDYDSYFERIVYLNSSIWTCSVTGKPSLTFEEAQEHEQNALKQIDSFPSYLEFPLLFMIHKFSCRARLDDLVNDVFVLFKDHYFINEELFYRPKSGKKYKVRVLSVIYDKSLNKQSTPLKSNTLQRNVKSPLKLQKVNEKDEKKSLPPEIPPPECYRYKLQVIDDDCDDNELSSFSSSSNSDDETNNKSKTNNKSNGVEIFENVDYKQILRNRNAVTKPQLKLIIKHNTEINDRHHVLKKQSISDYSLNTAEWTNIFAGPEPIFQQTFRLRTNISSKSDTKKKDLTKEVKGLKKKNENGCLTPGEVKATTNDEHKTSLIKKMIQQQQEELLSYFIIAEKLGIKNLDKWRQTNTLLTENEITSLKEMIKEEKELEKKKIIEKKKKEKEELLERKKPRDDLQCNDLKPLPKYTEYILPKWIPVELYHELLSIHNFFYCYSDIVLGSGKNLFTFNTIATAVLSKSPYNGSLFEVLKALLRAKTDCVTEEDGDEADINKTEEIGNEMNCDLDHKIYGQRIKEINKKHEFYRNMFGLAVRQLPVTPLTITEVLRLVFETSGYYTSVNVKMRQTVRGGLKCYDDEGFLFALQNPNIMKRFKTVSIFELNPKERIAIIQTLIQQLLSYQKFREVIDDRINNMYELRRELRNLREWDRQQERESREAHIAKEAELKNVKHNEDSINDEKNTIKDKKLLKDLLNLRNYLKYLNEGRSKRFTNDLEVKQLILGSLPFSKMELQEIDEFRELQRESFREKIYDLPLMGQCFLGKDRVFRCYYYLHNFSLLFIEKPKLEDISDLCCESASLASNSNNSYDENIIDQASKTNNVESDDSNKEQFTCKKSENCPLHNANTYPYYYYVENQGIQKILDALNLRGFREIELSENIQYLKDVYEQKMNKLAEKINKPNFLFKHFDLVAEIDTDIDTKNESISKQAISKEFCEVLLEMEQKIFNKNFGFPISTLNRDEWRKCIKENGDTSNFCVNNQITLLNSNEELFSEEDLKNLTSVQKYSVALLQLTHGISFDCIKDPFVVEAKKSKDLLQTTLFTTWQKGVAQCTSISELSLFMITLDRSIKWSMNKPLPKCNICEKKIELFTKKIIQCQSCKKSFHFACLRIDLKALNKTIQQWVCQNCTETEYSNGEEATSYEEESENNEFENDEKSRNHKEKLKQNQTNLMQTNSSSIRRENNGRTYKTLIGNGTSKIDGVSNKISFVSSKNELLNDNNNDMINEENGRRRRVTAKRYVDFMYADDRSEESESDSNLSYSIPSKIQRTTSDRSLRLRKLPTSVTTTTDPVNYRHLSMGLRESDDHRKAQLKKCEIALREAMRQPFGEAFVYPVDSKFVPDYYNIIKKPMDMQTMINKIKNFEYNTPEDLWIDCELIFSNCAEFNEDDSPIRLDAQKLKHFLKKKFEEILEKSIE